MITIGDATKYILGEPTVGAPHDFVASGGGGGASVTFTLLPALGDPIAGGIFPVATFHTHPTYSHWGGTPLWREVGPSSNDGGVTGDIPNAEAIGMPGVVWEI